MSDVVDVTRAELFKLVRRPARLGAARGRGRPQPGLRLPDPVPVLPHRSGGLSDRRTDASPQHAGAARCRTSSSPTRSAAFPVFAGALALVLGALVFGGEYGWGTVKTMLHPASGPGRRAGRPVAAHSPSPSAMGVLVLFGTGAASSCGDRAGGGRVPGLAGLPDLAWGSAAGCGRPADVGRARRDARRGPARRRAADRARRGVGARRREPGRPRSPAPSLTALQPVRDVLPGVNAGSLASA